jgi:hypothetical protein
LSSAKAKRSGYDLTEEDFNLFRSEILGFLSRLGLRLPVEFVFGLPEETDSYVLAGTILYESNQKVLFFLNTTMKKKPSAERLRYLALHEVIEFLLTDRFLKLLHKGKRLKKEEWEDTVHEVMNRLVCLFDPDLLQHE